MTQYITICRIDLRAFMAGDSPHIRYTCGHDNRSLLGKYYIDFQSAYVYGAQLQVEYPGSILRFKHRRDDLTIPQQYTILDDVSVLQLILSDFAYE